MIPKQLKERLEKQRYRLVGKHSAVKICTWTKKSIKDEDTCYKEKFYGIRAHLCCQMTCSLACCNSCIFCWRDRSTPYTKEWKWNTDSPKQIIKGCIGEQKKLLIGFYGNEKANKEKLEQAMEPQHFAISLSGEPTIYPKLNELIKELHRQNKTTFLVTNGMFPEKLEKIEPPTQLYLSVDAPNEELFKKIDQPLFDDAWQRFNKSLEIIKKLKQKTRTVLRITLIKSLNDSDVEGYTNLIKKADPHFIEIKSYMWVGFSRDRMKKENMPLHQEVVDFASELIKKYPKLKIIDEKKESRVVLLAKQDYDWRIMHF